MIRNYIKVGIRNLLRHKFFSIINVFGLAISMSICLAVIMLVADQLTYDRHNTKRDRIYRVVTRPVNNQGVEQGGMDNATSPMPLKQELLENYSGIEKVVRLKRGFGNNWLELENQNVNIPLAGYYADPEIFEIFEYELEAGDAATALSAPYSVVLTKKASRKLFNEENPLGLNIKMGENTFTVTGVLKETTQKSHIVVEAFASMSTIKSLEAQGKFGKDMENWSDFFNGWTYVLLEESKSPEQIQTHLDKIFQKHISTIVNPDIYKAKFLLQSLKDITPGEFINNDIGPSFPWVFVYFLGGLASVIMITSCFNFTNLSIARSLTRAKEIGIRKATGADRVQIFMQFLSESVIIALFSLIIALILLVLIKPLILQLTFARILRWDLEANYFVFGVIIVFATAVGIFAGFFPAVVLSGFQPAKVLKSLNNVKLLSRMGLRQVLLISQFTLSLIFILTVIIMYNQMNLFLGKDYGFDIKNQITVRLNNTSAQALKTELLKYNDVKSVTAVSHMPATGITYGEGFKKNLAEKDWTNLNYFWVDEDYLKNMQLKIIAGKYFEIENGSSNKNFIVINRQAAKALYYDSPLDAIGQQIIYQRDSTIKTVVGVVEDYNHQELMNKIEPLALMYSPDQFQLLQVKYSGNYESAVKSVEKAWAVVNPNMKIDYKDFEAEIKAFYNTVFGDIVNILGVIAFLAITISCLGLLGMATYATETRIKEIAIRKVMGASDRGLVLLLSKGFMKLLLIAIIVGLPLSWFINNLWLESMAYRTEISAGAILSGTFILCLLGALTIGSQTLRAAYTNPIDNLKNE